MGQKQQIGIRHVATPWQDLVIVCRKCAKACDGGFGPDGDLSIGRAIKAAARGQGRRDVRVIETKCLGLCPKNAVSVVLSRDPGEILVVPAGSDVGALLPS